MIKEYTHELKEEILSISGRYELEKEGTIPYGGRELLYVIGNAVVDSSCCGYGACRYAVVPGFVVEWKSRTDDRGFPVSEVEPVQDEALRERIRDHLQKEEWVSQVQFW